MEYSLKKKIRLSHSRFKTSTDRSNVTNQTILLIEEFITGRRAGIGDDGLPAFVSRKRGRTVATA